MAKFALAVLLFAAACSSSDGGDVAKSRSAAEGEGGSKSSSSKKRGRGVAGMSGDSAGGTDTVTSHGHAMSRDAAVSDDSAMTEDDAMHADAAMHGDMTMADHMAMAGSMAMPDHMASDHMGAAGSMAMAGAMAMPDHMAPDHMGAAGSMAMDADAAMPADASMHDHGGMTGDAGVPEDAAMPDDAAMPEDAAMPDDAATPTDAGEHMHPMPADDDAGTEPDAAVDPAEEHCSMEMPPDPRDSMITSSAPVEWVSASGMSRDVLMPPQVVDWINEQGLNQAHDAWHATRRWDQTCGVSAPAAGCRFAESLVAQNLFRAEYQQGAAGAGLAFLHMHRHMLHQFKAAFPMHVDLFKSWTHIPRSMDDPENPTPWREITWTDDNLIGFDILENIEQHLDMFPTEDDLGNFVESAFRWTPEDATADTNIPGSAVHGAVHREFAVFVSPANMGAPATSLPNYTFWKLHGFIDDVWERYRAAKGLTVDDEYRKIERWECRLMYYLSPMHRQVPPPSTDTDLKRGGQ